MSWYITLEFLFILSLPKEEFENEVLVCLDWVILYIDI